MRDRYAYPSSNLSGGSFSLPGGLEVRCVRSPPLSLLQAADASWIPQRRPTDVDWTWVGTLPESRDMFAIMRHNKEEPVAIFSSKVKRLLRLPDGPAYVLDYLEVGPAYRGTASGVSIFAMTLVAARALECGAKKLVLSSTKEATRFYDAMGGHPAACKGMEDGAGSATVRVLGRRLAVAAGGIQ